MNAPFNGDWLVRDFLWSFGEPRGDELELHASDVSGCRYATALRIGGSPTMPRDEASKGVFALGHAVEALLTDAFAPLRADGWTVTRGREVNYRGIVGHIDYDLEREGMKIVVDVTTTKAKTTDYKMTHALKSAVYALAIGAPMFAEVVCRLGFGTLADAQWHWFSTADYAPRIEAAIDELLALRAAGAKGELPVCEPPPGEQWRCRAYCDALCPRNDRLALAEIPL